MKNLEKFAVLGAAAGAATSFIMKYLMMALNWIAPNVPDVSIKLANPTLAVNIRESLTGLNGSFGTWLMDNIGLTIPTSTITNLLVSAVGGAAFFVVGGLIAEQIDYFGAKKSAGKVAAVIFSGSAAAGIVFGGLALPSALSVQAGVSLANVLIAFGINAAVLAGIYSLADKELGTGLVPK
jgi:hypothetical protein